MYRFVLLVKVAVTFIQLKFNLLVDVERFPSCVCVGMCVCVRVIDV